MKEIWRDIKDYKDYYQVSNRGRVRSLDRTINHGKGNSQRVLKGKVLSQIDTLGYLAVGIVKGSKKKFVKVHRLVATAFLVNSEDKPCVNHKDRVRTNNNLNNLEWCTYKENMIHIHKTGANMCKGECHKMSTLSEEQVLEIRAELKNGKTGVFLAKKFKTTTATISRIKTRFVWKHI